MLLFILICSVVWRVVNDEQLVKSINYSLVN